jgi:Ser-tRNA(Ala) deacylase AlaX
VTEKLFYQDPYLKEFKATVKRIDGNKVVLDKTAFFPFSGGQAGDTGTIGKCKVLNTVYENDEIVHLLETCLVHTNEELECKLDWERRYSIMKLHSAAHLVYEFFVKRNGKQDVIGSNIGESRARLDFKTDSNVGIGLENLEKDVNGFISEGHEIRTYDNPEKEGFRVWECEDMRMPCGGTHVKNTFEAGKLRLKRKNLGTGKERIEVELC